MATFHVKYLQHDFDISMEPGLKLLPFLGLYPLTKQSAIQKIHANLTLATSLFITIHMLFSAVYYGRQSLIDAADMGAHFGCAMMGSIKFLSMHFNRNKYERLLNRLKNDFWDGSPRMWESNLKTIEQYNFILKLIYLSYTGHTIFALGIFAILPVLYAKYRTVIKGEDPGTFFAMEMWMPFDKTLYYDHVCIYEGFIQCVIVIQFYIIDYFNATIVTRLYIHVKLLERSAVNIVSDEFPESCDRLKFKMKQRIRRLIRKHMNIIQIAKDMDDVLGWIMLGNFLLGSIFICLTGFTYSVVDVFYRKLKFLLFFVTCIVVLFYQCIYGQHLSDLSNALCEAIYSSPWYLADRSVQSNFPIVMQRAQKPLKLSAIGYVDMNFITFSTIVQTSWSYFTLLRTVYNN